MGSAWPPGLRNGVKKYDTYEFLNSPLLVEKLEILLQITAP